MFAFSSLFSSYPVLKSGCSRNECLLFQKQALLNLMEKWGHIRLLKDTDKYPKIKAVYSTNLF